MTELPAALREAQDAHFTLSIGPLAVTDSVCADRARCMAAALRWALTCREFWPEINAAIAALEQEARDA